MKKQELYKIINDLIESKKNSDSNDSVKNQKQRAANFISDYYQKYLRKNKLISRNHHQKIDQIMKSFQYLDTYVDLNDVIKQIDVRIQQSKRSKQIQNNQKEGASTQAQNRKNHQISRVMRVQTQPCRQQINRARTLKKADILVRESYNNRFIQLNKCGPLIESLQKSSNQLINTKFRNNAKALTYHQLMNLKYTEGGKRKYILTQRKQMNAKTQPNQDTQIESNTYHEKTPWEMLQQNKVNQNLPFDFQSQDHLNFLALKLDGLEVENSKQKRSNIFDRPKIINRAAAYLQIILQRQHFKKWQLKKRKCNAISSEGGINLKEKGRKSEKGNRYKINFRPTQLEQKDLNSMNSNQFGSKKSFQSQFQQPKNNRTSERISNICIQPSYIVPKARNSLPTSNSSRKSKLRMQQTFKESQDISLLRGCNQKESQVIRKNPLRKQSRFTVKTQQNLPLQQKYSHRELQQKNIREKFTFKKRSVKQMALNKISEFVKDIQNVQKILKSQSKNCEKQISSIQQKIQFQFDQYKSEKLIHDDAALQGIQLALLKLPSGLKRYKQELME